jgi:hypothetical protein
MNIFKSKAEIIAAIADVQVTGKRLDDMIHVAAASVVNHLEEHGDITLAQSLVDAMPVGSRVNALIAYFEKVGKVNYDIATKKLEFAKFKVTNMDLAIAKSWTDYKPEAPYSGFDLKATLSAMITKAMEAQSETDPAKIEKIKVNAGDLIKLQELAAQLGLEVKAPKPVKAFDPLMQPMALTDF